MSSQAFVTGRGAGRRQSHHPLIVAPPAGTPANLAFASAQLGGSVAAAAAQVGFPVQASHFTPPNWPFQPLPPPLGTTPFRYDLSRLLTPQDIQAIVNAQSMVIHTVGDTGDYRGPQKDLVAAMMIADAEALPDNKKPAFFYHLGDIVYFAGDIDKYGANFYATYKEYPGFIVSIPGNHDCQPDDPQDGAVDPNKYPLDGWVQNFMSPDPTRLGSLKTGAGRTQLDLPNVYWTFNTPLATIIGLFSNVGEFEGEIHQDQLDWFRGELAAANPELPLIVTVHHPPFSGDTEHSGSTQVYQALFPCFAAANRYPDLILSGHVHNYQRFTHTVQGIEVACVVAGAGGYTNLGKVHKIAGKYPKTPLPLGNDLRLDKYDQDNFGFLRLEISKEQILGTYLSGPYGGPATASVKDNFTVNRNAHTVT